MHATALRATLTLLLLAALSASAIVANEKLALWWNHDPYSRLIHWLMLVEGVLLCAWTPRACGLCFGDLKAWRAKIWFILIVLAVPPLSVVTVYAHFTSRPFHGIPYDSWLSS